MNLRDRVYDLLDRLTRTSGFERVLISLAALTLSMIVGTGLILFAGLLAECSSPAMRLFGLGFCYDPLAVFDKLFLGAFGDPINPAFKPFQGEFASIIRPGFDPLNGQLATTLSETTILIFAGVAVAIAFRAGIFNIGAQGQLVVGALATALALLPIAPHVTGALGTLLLLIVGLLVGGLAGGAFAAIPGALLAYFEANEVITTIMLNFVATSTALYLVANHFKDPESFANQTVELPDHALFPSVIFEPRDDFSILALFFGIAMLLGIWYLLNHTAIGYDIRTSGIQPDAAEYGGVNAERTILTGMTLSGALAGIGGAVYVLMMLGNFQVGVPDYGFDGITVSILAGNNPLGVGFAGLLFGVLKSGSVVVDVGTDVPPQLVGVLRGLIILFVAMPEFFRMIGKRVVPADRREPRGEQE
ncbi:ribose ABC transporter permease [Halodesulfurarchaeum formicicum]|uniref:Ribose ABC transporter permease n=1 Tax=Halodesulfurarchaeum formicicum TaxID=1873524 RepID=A0A1D8S3Q0_9EURY|nr:ABC transporter permease [Halodesulfurarchaeum formicicum]AOW79982.1 ribose ABC transporter permease [Halodesulfurarchaeum formicicum]